MANNVSSLRVRITGDASGLEATLDNSAKKVGHFSRQVQQSQRASVAGAGVFGGGSKSASFAVSQLGFGLEDFLTQVETMGIGGGLRAAGNNMSALAATMNPIAGLAVGVGTALGAILIPRLLETADAANEVSIAARALSGLRFGQAVNAMRLPEIPRLGASADEFDRTAKSAREMGESVEDEFDGLRREWSILAAEALPGVGAIGRGEAFDKFIADRDPFGGAAERLARGSAIDPEAAKRLRELEQAALAAREKLDRIGRFGGELGEAQKQAAALREFGKMLGEGTNRLGDFFGGIQQAAKDRDATRSFVTDFLGDIGGDTGRAARANAELDKRLREIDRLFPGAGNANRRQLFGDAARALAERDRTGPIKRSQGLAGGFDFGSREAISTLNKAAFTSSKTDDKIEKNTREAAGALKEIDRKLGRQDRGEPVVAGPPV